MIRQQPADTVGRTTLFVRRERKNDVAVRDVTFLFEAQQIRDKDRRHRFVVARAATIVVAVALGEDEGIEVRRPIGLARGDHVEVREQKQRLPRTGAVVAHDEIHLVGAGPEHLHVGRWKAGIQESLLHRLGRLPDEP